MIQLAQRIPSKIARQKFGELIDLARMKGKRFYITKKGRIAGGIVGPELMKMVDDFEIAGRLKKTVNTGKQRDSQKQPLFLKTYHLGIKGSITRKEIYDFV